MTADRRTLAAAALWALLALVVWNVLFDRGVDLAVNGFLAHRAAYVHGRGPRVEMASAMRVGIAAAFRHATLLAAPCAAVAAWLALARGAAAHPS
jgi:hypothetical protein